MKENATPNILPSMEWFNKAFYDDFLGKESKAKEQFNSKEYRLSDMNVSPRVINHWVKQGLLLDDRPDGKGWWLFSIPELMWLTITLKLRLFGLELNKILKVKEYLQLHSSEDNQSKFPILDFYIFYVFTTSHPVKLIVFADGQAYLGRQFDIDLAQQSSAIYNDFISIDIGKIANNEYKKQILQTDYLHYSFTEIEKEVHNSLTLEDVRSISIQVTGGKEYLIKKQHIAESKIELDALIKKVGSHFEETTVHVGNKKVHKITEKKKVKKE